MVNKSISQEDALPSITGDELYRIAIGGQNFKVCHNQLLAWLQIQLVSTDPKTIPSNTNNYVLALGSNQNYRGFTIDYLAKRSGKTMKGIIQVAFTGYLTVGFSEIGTVILPNNESNILNPFCTFAVSDSSGQINLLITTDSSDVNDTIFSYKITRF
jgi:hypothetical protein